jgi:hypothetical protein
MWSCLILHLHYNIPFYTWRSQKRLKKLAKVRKVEGKRTRIIFLWFHSREIYPLSCENVPFIADLLFKIKFIWTFALSSIYKQKMALTCLSLVIQEARFYRMILIAITALFIANISDSLLQLFNLKGKLGINRFTYAFEQWGFLSIFKLETSSKESNATLRNAFICLLILMDFW